MDATPSLLFGCTNDPNGGVLLDAHQTYTYVRWAMQTGQLGACASTFRDLNDLSCVADRPGSGGADPVNGGVPWRDPVTDEACWVTEDFPASVGFLGLWVHRVDIGRSAAARSIVALNGGGGVPTRVSRPFRTIRITGTAWATAPESLRYGVDWIERVLGDEACAGSGERGAVVNVRLHCPDSVPTPPTPDTEGRVVGFGAVLSSLTVLDDVPVGAPDPCCELRSKLEIVLTLANPYLFPCATVPAVGLDTSGAATELTGLTEDC